VLAEHVWPFGHPPGPPPGSQSSVLPRPVHVLAQDTLYVVLKPICSAVEQHTCPIMQSALDAQRTVDPRHVVDDPHEAVLRTPPVRQQVSDPWQ
jgi:hypothetical protein